MIIMMINDTPITRMRRRAGRRKKYLNIPPSSQKAVRRQLMNSNWELARVIRFQLLSSSATNLEVTSSSMILAIPVLT